MHVYFISIIKVFLVLVNLVSFDNPHGLHVTYKVRSHILFHVVCSDRILFVSNNIVCSILYKFITLKVVYANGRLLILKDKS